MNMIRCFVSAGRSRVWLAGLLALGLLGVSGETFAKPGINVGKAKSALARAAKAEDFDKIRDILGQLGESDDKKAPRVVLDALNAAPLHEVADAAIEALARLGTDHCKKHFDKILGRKKNDPRILATVIAVAEKLEGEQAEQWLVKGLETEIYFVYRNAIPPLVERRSKIAIPALIDLLEKVGIRPNTQSYSIRDALVSLTGQDFESIDDWRSFWEIQGPDFDPKKLGGNEGTTGVVRERPKGFTPPKFFDVEVLSSRVVFVVDISGSMKLWDPGEEKIGSGPDWKTRERMARVKHHLSEAVRNLPNYATFNIVAYSWQNRIFNAKGSVPADKRWKKKALEFIEGLHADGPTHTDDALEWAFEDPKVDTMFVLTDGAPSRENRKTKELMAEILEMVRKRNRIAKVKVFTFGFEEEGKYPPGMNPPPPSGRDDDEDEPTLQDFIDFLKRLAEDNGGQYTPVK